jgi:stage III sporulation protein AG
VRGMDINLKKMMEIKKIGKEKLILLVVAGIMLIGASYFESERDIGQIQETETISEIQDTEYQNNLETKVTEMIKSIKGVSNVSVMITLKSGKEKILKEDSENSVSDGKQENSSESSSNQKKNTVIFENENGESPYVVKEIYPQVEGIAVMGKGISNSARKEEIINMLSALFDIPIHKISVIEID